MPFRTASVSSCFWRSMSFIYWDLSRYCRKYLTLLEERASLSGGKDHGVGTMMFLWQERSWKRKPRCFSGGEDHGKGNHDVSLAGKIMEKETAMFLRRRRSWKGNP